MEEENKLTEIADSLENQMKDSPIMNEEIGSLDEKVSSEIDKVGYYAIFSLKDSQKSTVGEAIKNVHIARFESKRDLKKVVNALDSNGFKLVDILKGRPLSFTITTKVITETKIGD